MYQIIWQTQALAQFSEMLYYLDTNYSPAIGEQLLVEANTKITLLQTNSFIYRKTNRKAFVRRCLTNNHTVLYDQVNKANGQLDCLLFGIPGVIRMKTLNNAFAE